MFLTPENACGTTIQLKWSHNQEGLNPLQLTSNNLAMPGGHIYPGKPAPRGTGPTVHLTAQGTLEEVLERVTKAGGEVLSPPIAIPAGRFAYTYDLDGNSISFFQAN